MQLPHSFTVTLYQKYNRTVPVTQDHPIMKRKSEPSVSQPKGPMTDNIGTTTYIANVQKIRLDYACREFCFVELEEKLYRFFQILVASIFTHKLIKLRTPQFGS